ncbi:TetR/AcrR family transcriptional regulator [Streptomyces mangrovisoli]|uniref:TetR/AcrR family transcriptional regulator n=1 Tax=Streptomyces mangrovisoli TaxID=1428628 RepID=UPI000B1934DE|nr:TetR/AcrR family transcriptional regulator [Streptomyces mangrovisoli]
MLSEREPDAPVVGRAAQAAATRQQIIETAQRLFAARGFQATSLQAIADEMGLTKAAVYYHFRTKAQLLHASLDFAVEEMTVLLDEVAGMTSRQERLDAYAVGWVDFLVRHRELGTMLLHDPEIRAASIYAENDGRRRRVLRVLFGDSPTPTERMAYVMCVWMLEGLGELTDLADEDLRATLLLTARGLLALPDQPGARR